MKKAPSDKWVVVMRSTYYTDTSYYAVAAIVGPDCTLWEKLKAAVEAGSEKQGTPMRIYRASEALHAEVLSRAERQYKASVECAIRDGIADLPTRKEIDQANKSAACDDGLPF